MATSNLFKSSDGKTMISCIEYMPENNVKAIIQVSHGIGQHKENYEQFAQEMNNYGIGVCIMDTLGHGKSVTSDLRMYFGPKGSWNYLVQDMLTYNGILVQKYSTHIIVMGFSMGSFVTRTAMLKGGFSRADAFVLAGTGTLDKMSYNIVNLMINSEIKKNGESNTSNKINELAFGNYNKYFKPAKTGFEWLFKDEKAIKEYMADEEAKKYITPGMFRELLSAMVLTSLPKSVKKTAKNYADKPILMISGSEDPVGGFGKNVNKLDNMFKKAGFNDVKTIFYPNSRHDIFHDNDKKEVTKDLAEWIFTKEI